MNSAMLDTSFLITLTSRARANHTVALKYYRQLLNAGVPLHLSTVAIAEFEVRQRIADLGLHNFLVVPFNIDHAFAAASLTAPGFAQRDPSGQSRASVKDDVKLLAQCELAGVSHFFTDDAAICDWIERMRKTNGARALPYGVELGNGYSSMWFNDNQGGLLEDE